MNRENKNLLVNFKFLLFQVDFKGGTHFFFRIKMSKITHGNS
jgi:hypothetical protein